MSSLQSTIMNCTFVPENVHGCAVLATHYLAGKPLSSFYGHLENAGLVLPGPPILLSRVVSASAQLSNNTEPENSSKVGSSLHSLPVLCIPE